MKNKTKLVIYILWAASLFVGIFGGLCLYFAIAGEYDNSMGYFSVGSMFAPMVYASLVLGPVIGIVGWVLFAKQSAPDKALPGGLGYKIAAFAAAAGVFFTFAMDIKDTVAAYVVQGNIFHIFSMIFAALTVAYFILCGISSQTGTVKPFMSLLSFSPVLFCAMKVLYMYFDKDVAVNSPIKFICQLAYISYMLVFTAETGLSLGRGMLFPRYIFALCSAVAIGGCASIAAVITTLTGTECTMLTGVDAVAKLFLFIYAAYRLLSVTGVKTVETVKVSRKKNEE